MKSAIVKRSIVIDGHKTSVSLEDAFWSSLKNIARAEGVPVSKMVTEIDRSRERGNLLCVPKTSSALIRGGNRLTSAHHDCAAMLRTSHLGRAI
jgi:predicted DNA-binding ribbon-helix-helix protein